jgi:predicted ATPase
MILNGIGLENFRVFKGKHWFDFSPLTILTGTNSSGKSSLINAIKLWAKNYSELEEENERTLDLTKLVKKEFDTDFILERYGSLLSFVSYGNRKKQEFHFYFLQQHTFIDDNFEIVFTISIRNNKMKNGRLRAISMKSLNKNKIVFSVDEKLDKKNNDKESYYVTHIDLEYFLQQFEKLITKAGILYKAGKYPNGWKEIIKKESFEKILSESLGEEIILFDFSFFWKNKIENKNKFKTIVTKFYGNYNDKSLKLLSTDIIKVLSVFNWKRKQHTFFQNPFLFFSTDENVPFGFSLKEFIFYYFIGGSDFFYFSLPSKGDIKDIYIEELFPGGNWQTKEIKELNESEKEKNIKNLLGRSSAFIEEVFIPLTLLIDEVNPEISEKSDATNNETIFTTTHTEKIFYNEFIFEILSLLKNCTYEFKRVQFIDVDRIDIKRSFSVNTKDNFSEQMKKLLRQDEEIYNKSIKFMNKWLSAFEIAEKIDFVKEADSQFFKTYLITKSDRKVLLADYGHGISQILPIIMALIPQSIEMDPVGKGVDTFYRPKVIIIEEPENSLHPALQSTLADMFIEAAILFNIQLIIETHSEYLIRKLQYLTAKGKISPEHTQIYYFYHPEKVPQGEKQVKKINIKKDGFLSSEFGDGFFDESGRLMIELLKTQNEN